jgi:hypothetical protein
MSPKILHPTDFSECAKGAEASAVDLGTKHVILGAEIDVPLPECGRRRAIDWNALIAKLLNALDRWVAAYAGRGPAAVRAAIQFRPCGMSAASQATRGDGR